MDLFESERNSSGRQGLSKTPDIVERFEDMLRKKEQHFFDTAELEDIVQYYLGKNDSQKALAVTGVAIDQHPYATHFLLTRAQLLAADGLLRKALHTTRRVEVFDPNSPELHIVKGAILSKMGKKSEAVASFDRAVLHSERRDETYFGIGLECQAIGNYKDAIAYLKKAFRANPGHDEALHELAFCFEIAGMPAAAEAWFRGVIDDYPYNETAWHCLGSVLMRAEKPESALEAYDYACLINEEFCEAHFEKAEVLATLDRNREALQSYTNALALDPGNPRINYCIGECYETLGENARARQCYRKVLRADGTMAEAWFGMGVTFYTEGRLREAIRHVRRAIGFDEFNSEFWYMLGDIHRKAGHNRKAEQAYRNVTRIDPFRLSIWLDYTDLLGGQRRFREATDVAGAGLKDHPSCAELKYRLCGYLFETGKVPEALEKLEEALRHDFDKHNVLFDAFPHLRNDPNVSCLIEIYRK